MPKRKASEQLQPSSSRRPSPPAPSTSPRPNDCPPHFHCQPTFDATQLELCHSGQCAHCSSCRYCQKVTSLKHNYDFLFSDLHTAPTPPVQEDAAGDTHVASSNPSPIPNNVDLERVRQLEAENAMLKAANDELETEKAAIQRRLLVLEIDQEQQENEENADNDNDHPENEDEAESDGGAPIKREKPDVESPFIAQRRRSPEVVISIPKREQGALAREYERVDHVEASENASKKKSKRRSFGKDNWTAEEDDLLLQGLKMGCSHREMRKKLGLARSKGAIGARKHYLGL